MPLTIKKNYGRCTGDKPYAVVKVSDGSIKGCHATARKAGGQKMILDRADKEAKTDEDVKSDDVKKEDKDKDYYGYYYNVISFAELDEIQKAEEATYEVDKLTDQFRMIVDNVIHSDEVDRTSAINIVVNQYMQRVEGAMSSKAAGVIGSILKEIPEVDKEFEEETGVYAEGSAPSITKDKPFYIWKDASGVWNWFAIYSNNFRDDDSPPEIIAKESHETFVELVDNGSWPMPELRHWHLDKTRWGVATWLSYADGFAIASGVVDEGHEKEAELLSQMDDVRVSHGMPASLIRRDKNDPSVIVFHVTKEISPLPGWAAANKWTGFRVLKGDDAMPIPEHKKPHLRELGFSDDDIADLEKDLEGTAENLADAGVERKEVDTPKDETKEEDVSKTKEEETSEPSTEDKLAESLADVLNPVVAALTDVQARLGTLEAELKELKVTDEHKIAELKEETPTRSLDTLRDLLSQTLIGEDDARVDGRTSLGKDGPKETEPVTQGGTLSPFLNNLMTGNKSQ